MKKIIIIGLLLIAVFVTGCEVPEKLICIDHNEINLERVGQRDWRVPEGTIKIKIGGCKNVSENKNDTLED